MGKIVLLDELTINQIAAGEVIERPASVVKELVENSIDAGATKIDIEVQNGGIKKIRIVDNGSGMEEDDLEFAFERHATSKIRKAEDLETVKSMGFRGEALASVAAIANVELITKTEDDTIGHRIVVEGGNVLEKGEAGAQKGTTITVTNLFYNTPVRYKFLKKDYTELGYIEDAVTRIAIANPNVAIKLKNENKTIIQTPGNGDIKSIIYGLYGKDTSDGLIDVEYDYEDIKVSGVVGRPEIARGNKSYQMFFVNKRYVKNKTLSAGAEQAFKGLLPIGKFGFIVLELEMDSKKIDVNVHPTKLEIRFQEEQKVFKAVYHAIRESLLKHELVRDVEKPQNNEIVVNKQDMVVPDTNVSLSNVNKKKEELIETPKQESGLFSIFKKREDNEEILEQSNNVLAEIFSKKNSENTEEFFKKLNTEEDNKTEEKPLEDDKEKIYKDDYDDKKEKEKEEIEEVIRKITENGLQVEEKENVEEDQEEIYEEAKAENIEVLKEEPEPEAEAESETVSINSQEEKVLFNEMYNKTFGAKIMEPDNKVEAPKFENITVFEEDEKYEQAPAYKYCGTVFSTYLIIEMNDEMYMIDQHAAHERILYEKVKKNYYGNQEADSQVLLLPDIINLTHKEKAVVQENINMFEKAGFIIEEFGESTIRLIGVPSNCVDLDTKELFLEILDAVNTVAITAVQEKEDKFLATVACKAAVKAGQVLSANEVKELLDNLLKLPNPFTCPHGRPTTVKMSKYDIERRFNRK